MSDQPTTSDVPAPDAGAVRRVPRYFLGPVFFAVIVLLLIALGFVLSPRRADQVVLDPRHGWVEVWSDGRQDAATMMKRCDGNKLLYRLDRGLSSTAAGLEVDSPECADPRD